MEKLQTISQVYLYVENNKFQIGNKNYIDADELFNLISPDKEVKASEVIVDMISFIQKQLRILEGDAILEQMTLEELQDKIKKSEREDNLFDFVSSFSKNVSIMRNFFNKEGQYDAYLKLAEMIEELTNKQRNK